VKQTLFTLPGHLSSPPPPVISGIRVTRSLVLCVCFIYRCLSFCTFSFGHRVRWLNELGSWTTKQLLQSYHQYGVGSDPALQITKRCTWLAAASDTVYQLLANDGWFFPGTPTSSTTKTDRHDIAELLLKKINQSIFWLLFDLLFFDIQIMITPWYLKTLRRT
jgi:hypothetical protein